MRDSRVAVFTGTPGTDIDVSTATTTNGATLDLLNLNIGIDGDYWQGSPNGYGLGVELLFYSITGAQADVAIKWQVGDDGTNWVDDQQVIPATALDEVVADSPGGKIAISTRLRTNRRYARLVVTSTNMSGSSFSFNAWLSDGTNDFAHAKSGGPYIRL